MDTYKVWKCMNTSCGHTWLGRRSTCPNCSSFGKAETDDEMTKKVVDDNDLRKSF